MVRGISETTTYICGMTYFFSLLVGGLKRAYLIQSFNFLHEWFTRSLVANASVVTLSSNRVTLSSNRVVEGNAVSCC